MVKKKSHEERPGEPVSSDETIENQVNTEAEAARGSGTAGETKPTEGSASEEDLTRKLTEMQDKYIRLSAEFDNYRKRTLREKMEISKYAGENILIDIIPLMDDFERALKHMDTAGDCAGMKDGIDIIYGKFSEFLKQNGIKEIESMNSDFNVDLHEAVAKTPVDEDEKKGKVVDVLLKGYYLRDKVLRFAKVVVGE